jgi:hypothetical protein
MKQIVTLLSRTTELCYFYNLKEVCVGETGLHPPGISQVASQLCGRTFSLRSNALSWIPPAIKKRR